MWNQHRATWRVPVDLPVSYKGHVHPRRVEARLANLSTGGALMASPNPVSQGDSLDIALALPDSEPLSLLGQVVHAVPDPDSPGTHQVGVRFVSPDAVDRKTINQYLWRRLRALYGPAGATTT
jgi:c-di-GMP-binding flagellar brake protein YcgR